VNYEIRFSEEARGHLRQLSARERNIAVQRAETALSREPMRETRNLKMLRPNPLARYELRVGSFRVFFDVDEEAREVNITAIGRKEGNQLRIGDKEVRL
jgi:mRNA-degrading endonuclease RelE of RelBE toxin-antitoxin system